MLQAVSSTSSRLAGREVCDRLKTERRTLAVVPAGTAEIADAWLIDYQSACSLMQGPAESARSFRRRVENALRNRPGHGRIVLFYGETPELGESAVSLVRALLRHLVERGEGHLDFVAAAECPDHRALAATLTEELAGTAVRVSSHVVEVPSAPALPRAA